MDKTTSILARHALWATFTSNARLQKPSANSQVEMIEVPPVVLYKHFLRGRPRGHFSGLDVGTKYIGYSVSIPDNKVAEPIGVYLREDFNVKLPELVSKYNITAFVAGYPYRFGRKTPQGRHIESFMQNLPYNEPYTYWDNNWTSKAVNSIFHSRTMSHRKRKYLSDMFASGIILQDFLDYLKRGQF